MSTKTVPAIQCTCERCGAVRVVTVLPKTCHVCRSPYWNTPRKRLPPKL